MRSSRTTGTSSPASRASRASPPGPGQVGRDEQPVDADGLDQAGDLPLVVLHLVRRPAQHQPDARGGRRPPERPGARPGSSSRATGRPCRASRRAGVSSPSGVASSVAPPCTRRTRPSLASWVMSRRTVTGVTPSAEAMSLTRTVPSRRRTSSSWSRRVTGRDVIGDHLDGHDERAVPRGVVDGQLQAGEVVAPHVGEHRVVQRPDGQRRGHGGSVPGQAGRSARRRAGGS